MYMCMYMELLPLDLFFIVYDLAYVDETREV